MRVISCELENFASYKSLNFNFDNQGLCLIQGPTGSGKSTLCDAVPWILFGRTSKDGAADEVRSWNAEGPTKGTIYVRLPTADRILGIYRIRGDKQNDLYFAFEGDTYQRGKDLTDTQKIINNVLGFDLQTYLAGAYFHEFSQTAQFFIANAKSRRQLTEQMVDVKLPKKLTESLTNYKKELKTELTALRQTEATLKTKIEMLEESADRQESSKKRWEKDKKDKLQKYQLLSESFQDDIAKKLRDLEEEHKAFISSTTNEMEALAESILPDEHFDTAREELKLKIDMLDKECCPTCGNPTKSADKLLLSKNRFNIDYTQTQNNISKAKVVSLHQKFTSATAKHEKNKVALANQQNTYEIQIKELKSQSNPYASEHKNTLRQLTANQSGLTSVQEDIQEFQQEFADTELLLQVTDTLRGELIKKAIIDLQENTNKLLETHFDAEIRVKFDISEADKLDVEITKDGNLCSYTQLSKGQRTLLKLCYGVSVMRSVSNYNGQHFSTIMIDEGLDGLSEELKIKSYGLLRELATEHESVFVVEHSQELKSLFHKSYQVQLVNGDSQIEEA